MGISPFYFLNITYHRYVKEKKMNTYYLYLIGQANSLVINQMLKFALYMYILDNTGSSVIYSNIIAFSMLPIIFFSPIAGWICDYVKKKKLIVMLDVTSGIILSLFFLLSNSNLHHFIYIRDIRDVRNTSYSGGSTTNYR